MTKDAITAMETTANKAEKVQTTFVNAHVTQGFLKIARDPPQTVRGLLPLVQVCLVADLPKEELEEWGEGESRDPESRDIQIIEPNDPRDSEVASSAPVTLVPNETSLEIHVASKYTSRDKKRGRKKAKKEEDWLVTCLAVLQLDHVSDEVFSTLKQTLSVAKFNPRNKVSVFSVSPHVTITKHDDTYTLTLAFGVFATPFDGHVNPEIHMVGHLNIVNVIRQFLGLPNTKQLTKSDYVTPEFFYDCLEDSHVTKEIDYELQPEAMRSKLLDYQLETVGWVLDRERGESGEESESRDVPSPWKRFSAHGVSWLVDFVGLSIGPEENVLDILSRYREAYKSHGVKVVSRDPSRGYGLIADEMGLGKTVELLAVVLNNPRPPFPALTHYDEYSDRDVLAAKTTLILCPSSISQQWVAEVTKHVPSLSVFLYTGRAALDAKREKGEEVESASRDTDKDESRDQPIAVEPEEGDDSSTPLVSKHAQFLAQFDIVITSYEVASREVANALYNPLRGRVTRTKTKLKSRDTRDDDLVQERLSLQSPLSQLEFWRVILDEVQMVGNTVSNAAVVARIIPRVHAWGVSGTPIKKGMNDLLGMCVFLRCEPGVFYARDETTYSLLSSYLSSSLSASFTTHQKHWEMLMLDKSRFAHVIRNMSIRHTKRQVRDQLVLPPQERHHVRLRFNLVEEENYRHLREGVESAVSEAVASSLMREEREARDAEMRSRDMESRYSSRDSDVPDRYGVLPTPRPTGTFNIGGANPYASIMASINQVVDQAVGGVEEEAIDPAFGETVYSTWGERNAANDSTTNGTDDSTTADNAADSADATAEGSAVNSTTVNGISRANSTDTVDSTMEDVTDTADATTTVDGTSATAINGTTSRDSTISVSRNPSSVPSSSAPADLSTSTLSSWLLRLRQTCCHPRVGSGNKKALGNGILQTVSHVLDAMCDQALTQLLNDERSLFVEELEKGRVYELTKQPELGLQGLQSRVSAVEVRVGEIRDMAVAAATRYALKKKEVVADWRKVGDGDKKEGEKRARVESEGEEDVKRVKKDENHEKNGENGVDLDQNEIKVDAEMDDVVSSTSKSIFGAPTALLGSDSESESIGRVTKALQKYLSNSEELQTEKERKQAFLHRYRSWMDLLHRYYFFIATFHFQVNNNEKDTKEEGDAKKEEVEVKKEDKTDDLETHYYSLAEQIRTQLLSRPIERVDQDVIRLENAKELEMPEIHFEPLIPELIQASPFLESRVTGLLELINLQSEYLVDWMDKVRELLTSREEAQEQSAKTEESRDEKSPDTDKKPSKTDEKPPGDAKSRDEEKPSSQESRDSREAHADPYASGLDNQQYASFYIDAISYLLQLRDETLNAKPANVTSEKSQVILWYHDEYEEEELTDLQVSLKEALDSCHVTPVLGALKPIISALKTESGAVSLSVYNPKRPPKLLAQLNPIIKTITTATKACKDILGGVRSCFNSKVVYYKQLQQLSDNVSSLEELIEPGYVILDRLNQKISHLTPLIKRTKGRITYLQSLKGDDGVTGVSNMTGIHKMCVICQEDYIIVGSITVCGHYFCRNCLEEWWQTHNTCPMCKTVLSRDDVFSFTQQDKTDQSRAGSFAAQIGPSDSIGAMYEPVSRDTQQLMTKQPVTSAFGTKIDHVIKYIKMLTHLKPGTQIVIFSQWTEILTLLASALNENKIAYAEPKTLMTFLQSEDVTCFLLNAKFQSTGLTLVNATHVILCEPILNAALEAQAISRIHRMGQTQTTHVTIFTMADTVEEEVLRLAINKRLKSMDGDETFEENESRHVTSGVGALATDKSGEVVSRRDMWDALFPSET